MRKNSRVEKNINNNNKIKSKNGKRKSETLALVAKAKFYLIGCKSENHGG